ncbi:MAG: Uma2 family endonuclease [Armatimonadetes bacterium]|nr:Uma2 family endonuclease [Armatimonadota bacterium]
MSALAAPSYLTPEEYLVLERKAETKSEYYNGQMYAMSGASRAHNLVAGNLFRELSLQLRDRPCEAYINDMRVKVSETGLYTYPDVVVACGEIRFEDAQVDTLLNPVLVVEVLSPSTEAYDRGEKFAHYRRVDSLQEVVLISQAVMRVERFVRQGEDWLLTEYRHPDDVLHLVSVEAKIPLREIYTRVEFPENNERHAR